MPLSCKRLSARAGAPTLYPNLNLTIGEVVSSEVPNRYLFSSNSSGVSLLALLVMVSKEVLKGVNGSQRGPLKVSAPGFQFTLPISVMLKEIGRAHV